MTRPGEPWKGALEPERPWPVSVSREDADGGSSSPCVSSVDCPVSFAASCSCRCRGHARTATAARSSTRASWAWSRGASRGDLLAQARTWTRRLWASDLPRARRVRYLRARARLHVGLHTPRVPTRVAWRPAFARARRLGGHRREGDPGNYEAVAGRAVPGERAWESLRVVLAHPEVDHEVRLTRLPGRSQRRPGGCEEGSRDAASPFARASF